MSTFDSGAISGRPPLDGQPPLPPSDVMPPGDAVPMPMPIPPGDPGVGNGRARFVAGSEGDDRLMVQGGATVLGNGGNDVFVLTSSGQAEGSELLGVILDLQAGDSLDLSLLGESSAILARGAQDGGGERISIDYDGDGHEDGFVIAFDGSRVAPDDGIVADGEATGWRLMSDWIVA